MSSDMKKSFLSILFAMAVVFPLFAQRPITEEDFAKPILDSRDRAAGIFHSYEVPASAVETPAPLGYKPIYISHYGRHGSRRQLHEGALDSYNMFCKLHEMKLLTDEGEELLKDLEKVAREHIDMEGELSERGALEHRGIASRMYSKYRKAFRKRKEVDCISSNIQRCIISMTNFTGELLREDPDLQISWNTGEKYKKVLLHGPVDLTGTLRRDKEAKRKEAKAKYLEPDGFISRYVKDAPEAKSIIGNRVDFMNQFVRIAAVSQDLSLETGGVDLFRYLTDEELLRAYAFLNSWIYGSIGNPEEWGECNIIAYRPLVADIVEKADAALAPGSRVAADLRFGHDSGLLPLVGLIGLKGPGDRYPMDSHLDFATWRYIPMGSNLQIVFYRNRRGNTLVKFLYNERETTIRGLEPFKGPYYKWESLRPYLVGLSK